MNNEKTIDVTMVVRMSSGAPVNLGRPLSLESAQNHANEMGRMVEIFKGRILVDVVRPDAQ